MRALINFYGRFKWLCLHYTFDKKPAFSIRAQELGSYVILNIARSKSLWIFKTSR